MAADMTLRAALSQLATITEETCALMRLLDSALPEPTSPVQLIAVQNIDRVIQRLNDCKTLCNALAISAPEGVLLPADTLNGLILREILDVIQDEPPPPPKAREEGIEWL